MSNYTLHAVIVKNNLSLDEAKKIAKDFIKGNKHYYRETKNSYRFRNYPKNYFKPKSYRTKKINQDISLIYGDVKPEYLNKIDNTKYGEGLFDFLKSKFTEIISPRLDYSDNAKNILSQFGNTKINSITVYRTPIQKIITQVLNIISLGKFDKLKQKYNFDDLFHLALIVNTENKNIIIEKNEVVNISFNYETTTQTKTKNVDLLNKNITILELLDNTRKRIGDNKFFVYDYYSQNCQVFLKDILESNNLYNQDLNNFIFQDITQLIKELPVFAKKGARFLTDVGAFFRKLTGTSKESNEELNDILKKLKTLYEVDLINAYNYKDLVNSVKDYFALGELMGNYEKKELDKIKKDIERKFLENDELIKKYQKKEDLKEQNKQKRELKKQQEEEQKKEKESQKQKEEEQKKEKESQKQKEEEQKKEKESQKQKEEEQKKEKESQKQKEEELKKEKSKKVTSCDEIASFCKIINEDKELSKEQKIELLTTIDLYKKELDSRRMNTILSNRREKEKEEELKKRELEIKKKAEVKEEKIEEKKEEIINNVETLIKEVKTEPEKKVIKANITKNIERLIKEAENPIEIIMEYKLKYDELKSQKNKEYTEMALEFDNDIKKLEKKIEEQKRLNDNLEEFIKELKPRKINKDQYDKILNIIRENKGKTTSQIIEDII